MARKPPEPSIQRKSLPHERLRHSRLDGQGKQRCFPFPLRTRNALLTTRGTRQSDYHPIGIDSRTTKYLHYALEHCPQRHA